ncbi:protein SFI1 homolog [Bradyrhizobium oligotrophicum S58]|uniref:Protein SFI1 homolog n=1 Tax=Bradyrhizobium oligotrophicum S58 TaxID=1245469 RepID=M4Z1R7_9BRAD|nr:protein SFI1 homolog [Bradyrhizobium oligotrophicum S58]
MNRDVNLHFEARDVQSKPYADRVPLRGVAGGGGTAPASMGRIGQVAIAGKPFAPELPRREQGRVAVLMCLIPRTNFVVWRRRIRTLPLVRTQVLAEISRGQNPSGESSVMTQPPPAPAGAAATAAE